MAVASDADGTPPPLAGGDLGPSFREDGLGAGLDMHAAAQVTAATDLAFTEDVRNATALTSLDFCAVNVADSTVSGLEANLDATASALPSSTGASVTVLETALPTTARAAGLEFRGTYGVVTEKPGVRNGYKSVSAVASKLPPLTVTKALPASALDLSLEDDESGSCCLAKAGHGQHAVAWQRTRLEQASLPPSPLSAGASRSRDAQPPPHTLPVDDALLAPGESADGSRLVLSERAVREMAFVDMLPTREFWMDEYGRVLFDSAFTGHGVPLALQSELVDLAESAESWKAWRQRRVDVSLLRAQLIEHGVAAAGHRQTLNTSGPIPGSERHSSPACTGGQSRRRSQEKEVKEGLETPGGLGEDGSAAVTGIADQYRCACEDAGVPESPIAYHALCTLDGGGDAFPKDFSGRAYLGNRGAQVLFASMLAVADAAMAAVGADADQSTTDPSLSKLRELHLAGQGIGNEAALLLATLLPRCPQLCELDLCRNHISEKGAYRLLQQVAAHPRLVDVRIDENPAPSWVRVRLKELLEARRIANSGGPLTAKKQPLSPKKRHGRHGSAFLGSSPASPIRPISPANPLPTLPHQTSPIH